MTYDDEVTVCPDHLRFVPCRRCEPGQERYSTDPEDVRRTQEFQRGEPHHPIAEWVVRHLDVTLSPWQRRLLEQERQHDH